MATASGVLFQNPIVKPLSPNGTFMSGCTATFYLTGTTTLTPIYADGALTTPLANPMTADSSGTFVPIYLDQSVLYRVQIKTSTGLLISDTDPVAVGVLLNPRTAAEIAAGVTPTSYGYQSNPEDARRFGADPTGAADSGTAFNALVSSLGPAVIPYGTYKTAATPTGAKQVIVYGAFFNGANPLNAWTPNWGIPAFQVIDNSGANAFIGNARQLTNFTGANGSFPTGTTGYGRMDGTGNQAYGVFGRADLYKNGVATNEFDSFNFAGFDPTGTFPPNMGFGTADYIPIACQVAAYGNNKSLIGYQVAFGSQKFIAGMYINPSAVSQYGIFIDSGSAVGPTNPLVVKGQTGVTPVTIQTVGAFNANNTVLAVLDGLTSATRFAVKQDGHPAMSATATTATAGTNGAVPAQVSGYFIAEVVGGALVKIPYYNT
jgi:hypothetical protein